jgi:DNA-binding NarL/FixJ family response regulator
MYKIVFIDEQQDDIEAFKDYVDETNTKNKFEVLAEYPREELGEMIDVIFSLKPDAVVVDYMLNEYKEAIKYNVPYNGVDLVEELLSIREGFPCFVMTAFDDDAIKEIADVNKVYIKGILHGSEKELNAKANFLERVESQINHYKTQLADAESKLMELIELRKKGEATIEQEQEMIELDQYLERSIDKKSSIPQEFKSLSNTKKLEDLLNKVDELLQKVKTKDGE